MHRMIHAVPMLLLISTFVGCSSSQTRSISTNDTPDRDRPIAILNGTPIFQDDVRDALGEYGGDVILREFALDRALEQRCDRQGISISNELLAQEREFLSETLGFNSAPSLSTNALNNIRAARGLGPVRYDHLLRRSAMLRALVGTPDPSEPQIERLIQSAYGDRYRVRLFVSSSSGPAQAIRDRTQAVSDDAQPWTFAEVCAQSSIHPSSPKGGLIESLSPASFGYPAAVLAALKTTPAGQCSRVLSTESGYAVVYVEQRIPARDVSDDERDRLVDQLRRDTQRIGMQRLAAEILDEQELIVMDRALNWAWTNRR